MQDEYQKAKDKAEAERRKKERKAKYGFLGSKSKAYEEAQQALAEVDENE